MNTDDLVSLTHGLNITLFCCFCLEPAVIAKSSLLIDIKPWDDETGIIK